MSDNSRNGGIGFIGALTILFIALKLLGVLSWRWLWVLSPIWISVLIWVVIVVIAVVAGWRRRR